MDIEQRNNDLDMIERVIDQPDGLQGLMGLIAEVCSLKADHLESNWQDSSMAKEWNGYAAGFMRAEISFKHIPYVKQVG